MLVWAYKAEERSRTMLKRVLGWITFLIAVVSFLFEGIRFYLDVRK